MGMLRKRSVEVCIAVTIDVRLVLVAGSFKTVSRFFRIRFKKESKNDYKKNINFRKNQILLRQFPYKR